MSRTNPKRYQFQTVSVRRDGKSSSVVKFHTTLANALHFCNQKNTEGAQSDSEFAVLVRTDKRPNKGGVLPLKADSVGAPAKPVVAPARATNRW